MQTLTQTETLVLEALRQSDCTQGELHDATGLPYSQLQPLLNRLVAEKKIKSQFSDGAIPYLVYYLPIAEGFTALPWFRRGAA